MTTAITASRMRHARGVEASDRAARAERQAEEPDHARQTAPAANAHRRVAVGVRDRAEQEHRVEVDVRVEPGQREAGERPGERCEPTARRRGARAACRCWARPAASASAGDASAAPPGCTPAAPPARRSRPGRHAPPSAPHRRATARRAAPARRPTTPRAMSTRVRERADRRDGEHVLAAQPLAQHERGSGRRSRR